MARTPSQPATTERARRRRSELLSAARVVFEEVGYANATVAHIVRVSGGSRASFYSYFTSADDALHELVQEMTDELFTASTRPIERRHSPFQNLVSTIRQFMQAYRARARLLAVLDQATLASERFRAVRLEIRRRFADALAATLEARMELPDADGLDADATAIALGGMIEDMARGRYLLGHPIGEKEAIHTLAVIWARTIGLPTR